MKKDIRSDDDKDARDYRVLDLDTGRFINYVIRADDETGKYIVLKRDIEGKLLLNEAKDDILTEERKGRIKLININDTIRNVYQKNRSM